MITKDGTRSQPLIKRLSTPGKPLLSLNKNQTSAILKFRETIDNGTYRLSSNPCLCGERDDVLVACCDRYGLEIKTVLCRSCGLMRTDPYLDEESVAQFYEMNYRQIYTGDVQPSPEFFDHQLTHGREIIRFLEMAGVRPLGRVLEVGCGAGGILQAFRQNGSEVAGCDFGKHFLEYGQRQGLHLEYGDVTSLFRYAPVHLVILSHVLEHFRDPVGELRKVRSLLDSNGYLYVEVPGLFCIGEAYLWGDVGRYLQNAHVYHFCLESLDYVLSLAGFSRMKGDEKIRAVYQRSAVASLPQEHLADKTIRYLQKLEWQQRYRRLRAYGLTPSQMLAILRRKLRRVGILRAV
ncbi:MAG: class I SAM-dependent methyltransferase [Deltaproteobacteria bacterium]